MFMYMCGHTKLYNDNIICRHAQTYVCLKGMTLHQYVHVRSKRCIRNYRVDLEISV